MPGPVHQSLLFLLKHNPQLIFELARNFDETIAVTHERYEAAANELPKPSDPSNIVYADWLVAAVATPPRPPPDTYATAVAVEVQTSDDYHKYYSWLSYAAGVRRVFKTRGWTIVFAHDAAVRRRAQKMFVDEPRASPWFVLPNMLPPILEVESAAKDVDKAVLTAVFHMRSNHAVAGARAALEAMKQVAHEHQTIYRELLRATMTEQQIEQIPKRLIEFDPEWTLGPMEKESAFYVRGHRKGREEGREEGREAGRLVEARRIIQRVLDGRGVSLDEAQRQHIEACEDLTQLEDWLDRALVVADAAELFK